MQIDKLFVAIKTSHQMYFVFTLHPFYAIMLNINIKYIQFIFTGKNKKMKLAVIGSRNVTVKNMEAYLPPFRTILGVLNGGTKAPPYKSNLISAREHKR